MALMYYSRMRAIVQLEPLLASATVVSVYASSSEDKLFEDDLSLHEPGRYSYNQARSHMVYMHTLFFEKIAEKNKNMSLVHIFPGLVITPAFKSPDPDMPTWISLLLKYIFLPFIAPWVSVPLDECGKRMLSLRGERLADVVATNGVKGGGSYGLTWNGESNFKDEKYKKIDKDAVRRKVWQHTNAAFDVIADGGVFRD